MHLSDGVLDVTVVATAGVVSVGAVAWSAASLRRGSPRIGAAVAGGAGLMLAHLADVPVAGGHTAHLIGATLLAIALGPALAIVTMASVLALEAVLLGDGGVAALGVNVLVMAVVGVLVGWGVNRALLRLGGADAGLARRVSSAGVAAVASVLASGAVLNAVVALGGGGWGASATGLLSRYAAWGVLEGVLTGAFVAVGLVWWRAHDRLRVVVPPLVEPCAVDGELQPV